MNPTSHITEKDWYFTFYTAISLNYRFLASASVHTYEEEEDRQSPRPKKKKRVNTPPPDDNPPPDAPPTTSPESVD